MPPGSLVRGGLIVTRGTGTEQLQGMLDARESVSLRDPGYPRLDLRLLDLLGEAALATYQVVVMMVARARAIQGLAVGGTQRIDAPVLGESLQ